MSSKGITVTAVWHDEDAIEVLLEASSQHFSGAIRAYSSPEGLQAAVASIAGFPTAREDSRVVLLGAFGPEWAGGAARLRSTALGLKRART
jgi:hypothetical protein